MQLLVFAHTPPPLHGQSAMVEVLVNGFRGDRDIDVLHVNPRLSRDAADVGRVRLGKFFTLLAACFRAWVIRRRHGPAVFYYVPAPGKRGALLRDLIVMALCRPFFPALVLHWHAVGLGDWLATRASAPERWLARWLLGRADLAIVLSAELASDITVFASKRVAVVPNCAPDPGSRLSRAARAADAPCEVLFLGLGAREKGLFTTLEGVAIAQERIPNGFRLTVAGGFESAAVEAEFRARLATLPAGLVQYLGFADDATKRTLFGNADVFCFPTAYPHEGQPLTLVEALAYDLPVITTRWRGIPGMLPPEGVWFVEPGNPVQLANALGIARGSAPPNGALRRHYLAQFTPARHLGGMKAALQSLCGENPSA